MLDRRGLDPRLLMQALNLCGQLFPSIVDNHAVVSIQPT
ncbi:hypothetical protein ETAE_0242 [Edwardsiella piscicida]|uniref:Uncharacterized protein n=1 Tax=Edwardsiella piscicida TaxID=1263550 RepID=A0AAU8PEK4_EDWPI|nr:hypothetical protein ETAE_0242 [Edwardsiella tarda EIB202]